MLRQQIEALCDLEPGEPGINAAKVRWLRAKICRQRDWQPRHADQLTLSEAADVLEGVQNVSSSHFHQAAVELARQGLVRFDTIRVVPGE